MRALYYDPARSGHGLGVYRRDDGSIRAATWYAFDGQGDQCWLLLVRRADDTRFDVYRPRGAAPGFPIGASLPGAGATIGIASVEDLADGRVRVRASLQSGALYTGPQFSPPPPPVIEVDVALVESPLP